MSSSQDEKVKRFAQQLDILRVALIQHHSKEKCKPVGDLVNCNRGSEKQKPVGDALVKQSNQNSENKGLVGEPPSNSIQTMPAEQARSLPRPLAGRLKDIAQVVQNQQKFRKVDPNLDQKPSNPHVLPDHVSCQRKIEGYLGVTKFWVVHEEFQSICVSV